MKKYNFLNVIRLIMALIVVANHLHPFNIFLQSHFYLNNLYNFIIYLPVPFFFLSTGFFIGKKIKNINNFSKDEFNHIKKVKNKNIKMYLIFTAVYLPLTIYSAYINRLSIIEFIISFFRGFLFIGENFNSWILWFLLSEIYGLSLIYYFKKFIKNNNVFLIIGFVLFNVSVFLNIFYMTPFFNSLDIINKILLFVIPNGRILTSILYLSLGIFISKNEKCNNKLLILITILIFTAINSLFNNTIFTSYSVLFVSTLLFYLVINIKFNNTTIADFCKFTSVKMYFLHLIIWSIISYIKDGIIYQNYGLSYFLMTVILIIIYSLIKFFQSIKLQQNNDKNSIKQIKNMIQ